MATSGSGAYRVRVARSPCLHGDSCLSITGSPDIFAHNPTTCWLILVPCICIGVYISIGNMGESYGLCKMNEGSMMRMQIYKTRNPVVL